MNQGNERNTWKMGAHLSQRLSWDRRLQDAFNPFSAAAATVSTRAGRPVNTQEHTNVVVAHVMLLSMFAKSLQSCLTLWDPMDCSPPGSAVLGILQARTVEWVAISFSNA